MKSSVLKKVAALLLRKETAGANYLRIRSTAPETDDAGMLVESVEVKVANRQVVVGIGRDWFVKRPPSSRPSPQGEGESF
jgi:hypothetical protein